MNNKFIYKVIVVVWCSLVFLFPACSVFKTPEPRLPENLPVTVFNITPNRAALKVQGVYYNPNSFGFVINDGDLDLVLDTFFLGHVKIDTSIEVKAKSLFTVPVIVEPDFERLSNSGLDLSQRVPLSFKGTMSGKLGWFSKTIDIEYQGMHFMDIKF